MRNTSGWSLCSNYFYAFAIVVAGGGGGGAGGVQAVGLVHMMSNLFHASWGKNEEAGNDIV